MLKAPIAINDGAGPSGRAFNRLDVVFARDRTPQSHLFADEFPEFFRAAQRERHLLCLIELLGDVRSTGSD